MVNRLVVTLSMAAVALLALSGCATTPSEEPVLLTLDQAKQDLWTVEDEIVALVPQSAVVETYPRTETSKTLFECDTAGEYYWPGGAQLRIDPGADSAEIIGGIHDAFADRPEWEVTWVEKGEKDGVYHVDLVRDDGLHFAVVNLDENSVLDIPSFTACFALEGYDPTQSY